MEERFLIFIDGTNDAAMFPVASLLGVSIASEGAVVLNFVNGLGPNATEDKRTFATLTVTADTELTVFKAIAEKIVGIQRANKDLGYVTVCDDVNSVFLHKDILSCAITLDT